MENAWQNTLAQLRQYINDNPSISIGSQMMVIPGEVRPGFYRLFDKVEADFVKEYFPDFLEKGGALGKAWSEATRSLTAQLALESITINPAVNWFLKDPLDGLTRALTDPLFEVLQGKSDAAAFDKKSRALVASNYASFFKEGYRRWTQIAILNLLAPDQNYRVPAQDDITDTLMGEGHENPGMHVAYVPEAEQVNRVSFQQQPVISFIVPKVLVRSARLRRFVGLDSEIVEPQWTAREVSGNVEWYNFISLKRDNDLVAIRPDQKFFPDLGKILPDVSFYTATDVYDVTLIADHTHLLRLDLAVEIMETSDWFEKGKLSAVKRHHAVMKPRFGTFVVCIERPPQAALDELAPKPSAVNESTSAETTEQPASTSLAEPPLDIHILEVGYDQAALEPIIQVLSDTTKTA